MIVILMGVAGSGKTTIGQTLANQLGWPFFDADDFHSVANRAKMANDIPLNDDDRADWLSDLRKLLTEKTKARQPIVLACSALKESYRQILQINAEVHFVYLKGTYEQIRERMERRKDHYMSAAMLDSQFKILEEPARALVVDITMEPSAIADAICKGLNLPAE